MRRLILATIMGLGLLGGTAAMTPGQAGPALQAAPAASAVSSLPVQYRGDYRPRHYAPPPPHRAYRQRYAPPPRPYYRQRYAPPRPQYRQRYVAPRQYAPPRAHYRR